MQAQFSQSRKIWSPKDPSRTGVEALRRFVNRKHGLNLGMLSIFTLPRIVTHRCCHKGNYHELHTYSITDWAFWVDIWEFLGIIYSVPPKKVITHVKIS